jgi:tetraacyldisaccharide 4'-kinase
MGLRAALQTALLRAWNRKGWLARLLWPISLLYAALAGLRGWLYRLGIFKIRQVSVPVIVVGNVVAGGAGKTPVVMALVRHLQAQGLKVGVVSRGHGRRTRDCREVRYDSPASEVGDEPALIRRACKAPVFVASQRFEAASALLKAYPDTQVILCDDGLQHLGLARDIEICVFDERGVGNGWLLPAGPLREHWPRAVDLVLHTGSQAAFEGFRSQRALSSQALRSDGSSVPLASLVGPDAAPLMAVAGIARPEVFFAMLRSQGLVLAETVALPDHYDFDSLSRPFDGGYTLICTEKDAVKLWRTLPQALAVPLDFTPEPAFLTALDSLLETRLSAKLSSTHGHTTS